MASSSAPSQKLSRKAESQVGGRSSSMKLADLQTLKQRQEGFAPVLSSPGDDKKLSKLSSLSTRKPASRRRSSASPSPWDSECGADGVHQSPADKSLTVKQVIVQFKRQIKEDYSEDDDKSLVKTVIMAHQYFITLKELVEIVVNTFEECVARETRTILTRVFMALRLIIGTYKIEIQNDPGCMFVLNKFIAAEPCGDERQTFASFLSRSLSEPPPPRLGVKSPRKGRISNDVDAFPSIELLAQQMAIVEYSFFSRVTPRDLFGQRWLKETADQNNVTAWIEHSNKLSQWICTKILRQPGKSERGKMIGKFIKVLDVRQALGALREMRCFSAMFTVYMTLNLFCLTRLYKSWKTIPRSMRVVFEKFDTMLKPMSNFSGYREKIAQAPMPCVPYVGILTKDLVALDELPNYEDDDGGTTSTDVPHVASDLPLNVFKMTHISKVMHSFFKRQKATYGYTEDDAIIYELLHPEGPDGQGIIPETELVAVSERVEPDPQSRSGSRTLVPESPTFANAPSVPRFNIDGEPTTSVSHRGSGLFSGWADDLATPVIQACSSVLHSTYHSAMVDDEGVKDLESVTLLVDTLHCLTSLQAGRNDGQIPTSIPLVTFAKRLYKLSSKLYTQPLSSSVPKTICRTAIDSALHVLAVPSNVAAVVFTVAYLAYNDTKSSLNSLSFSAALDDTGSKALIKIVVSPDGGNRSPNDSEPPVTNVTRLRVLTPILDLLRATVTSSSGVYAINMVCPVASSQVNHEALARLSTKPVGVWSIDDVYEWGLSLRHSADTESFGNVFARNGINGELLLELSSEDLTAMGLSDSQIKPVMTGITTLRRKASRSPDISRSSSSDSPQAKVSPTPAPAPAPVKIDVLDLNGKTLQYAFDASNATDFGGFTDEIKRLAGVALDDSQIAISFKYEDSEGDSILLSSKRFEEHLGYIKEDMVRGSKSRIVMVPTATQLNLLMAKVDESVDVPMVVTTGIQVDMLLVKPMSFYLDLLAARKLPTETSILTVTGPRNIRLNIEKSPSENVCIWEFMPIDDPAPIQRVSGSRIALSDCKEVLTLDPRPAFIATTNGIVSLNRKAIEVTGLDIVDIFHKSPGMLSPSFAPEIENQVKRALLEHEPGHEEESSSILFQKKDGSLFVAMLTTAAMESASDSAIPTYCIGYITLSQ